ncbi:phosphonate C-P lyase system protein PhnG [Microbacterium marinilacus]|uniref:Phosphonate C-P lyase system protein PhnG n=1 Tax=Microbacterium marinilacus TaxID=415209 RepID=A0ABP7B5Y8_9MICO|nr:phosphonate C-P lyase system protein PhnG [Microbacterium marinilacus]MBY0687750.1 phosphonate C-P lyase system protein PhnG [Microbacterium marinilacus]
MEHGVDERRRTARVLALASAEELAGLWAAWPDPPEIEYLRGPEAGLVMVQGRMGGTGDRFHLGEATVTRATVLARIADAGETVGTAYVLGSHPEHAGLAAVFDALLLSAQRDRVLSDVIEPLESAQRERDEHARAQARSTVVDFFTVSRENSGPDEDDDE